MKKNAKGLSVLLIICGLFLSIGIMAKTTFVDELAQSGIAQGVSHRMMDVVFAIEPNDMEYLSKVQTEIEQSKEIRKIVVKTLDAVKKADETVNVNYRPEVKNIIKKVYQITEKQKGDEVANKVLSGLQQQQKDYEDFLNESLFWYVSAFKSSSSTIQQCAKLYFVLTDWLYFLVLGLASVGIVFTMLKYSDDPQRTWKTLGIDCVVLAGLLMLGNHVGSKVLVVLSNRYLGRTILNESLFKYEILALLVLVVICAILSKTVKKQY